MTELGSAEAGPGAEAGIARALELAYRYLNRRERTAYELRQHLLGHGLDIGPTEAAIEELSQLGYLDDTRYARMFTQDKRRLENWGSGRITRALRARGIDRELIEEALAEDAASDETELDRALALLRQRFTRPPQERRERDRALGLLLRRGYEPELATQAISAYARGDA